MQCNREPRHYRERFYIGPKSVEIALEIGRNRYAGLPKTIPLELKVERLYCGPCKEKPVVFKPYGNEGDTYFFLLDGEFMTNPKKFPRGFYIGALYWKDCLVDKIEIVKAPGTWIASGEAVSEQCVDTSTFVEPPCVTDECDLDKVVSCQTGVCRTKLILKKASVRKEYAPDLNIPEGPLP